MAQPTVARGTKLNILLGDGASPEVFGSLCALTTKQFNCQSQETEVFIEDCDNKDAPAWREIITSGLSIDVSGSGQLATTFLATYRSAWLNGTTVNARIELDIPSGDGGGYWSGAFRLSSFSVIGPQNELVQVELTLRSSGPATWVDATP